MRRSGRRGTALSFAVLAWASAPAAAGAEPALRADDSGARASADTTYGRIDGDLGVSVGAGAVLGPTAPRATLDLRLRYLDTAGLYASYEDGLAPASSNPRRVVATGFELRPLFLTRWLSGAESGVARFDLLLDSLGLEVGAFFEQPDGAGFAARPGFQAGLGLEIPLLKEATGPWIGLHGGARWSDGVLRGAPTADAADRSLFLSLTLAYHAIFASHLVDVRDAAPP